MSAIEAISEKNSNIKQEILEMMQLFEKLELRDYMILLIKILISINKNELLNKATSPYLSNYSL